MPKHDAEKCAAVFWRPSRSKLLESNMFMIWMSQHPNHEQVRRGAAYNMSLPVRSKKMASFELSLT
jgi:hypothetical protein